MSDETVSPQTPMKAPALDAALMSKLALPLLPAEDVGRDFFGLGVFATRAAVRRGDLPTIRVGRKHYCQTTRLREMLGLTDKVAA